MAEIPAAFYNFPRGDFPITIEILDAGTDDVRWSATADGPGAVYIPPRNQTNEGRPVDIRVTFGTGVVQYVRAGQ